MLSSPMEILVRFPPALVEWALAQAPSTVTLCRRGSSQPMIRMEGMNVSFGTGSDCPNYLDPHTGKQRLFSHPGCDRLHPAGGCAAAAGFLHVDGHPLGPGRPHPLPEAGGF